MHSDGWVVGSHYTPSTNETVEHWEARFLGTFSEIGDYFNISSTENPSPGAQAAWRVVQRGMKPGYEHHYLVSNPRM